MIGTVLTMLLILFITVVESSRRTHFCGSQKPQIRASGTHMYLRSMLKKINKSPQNYYVKM